MLKLRPQWGRLLNGRNFSQMEQSLHPDSDLSRDGSRPDPVIRDSRHERPLLTKPAEWLPRCGWLAMRPAPGH